MKKILSVMLMLCMLLMCGAGAESAALIGEWYTEMMGLVVVMTINEDGTYTLDVAGDIQGGTWVLEGESLYVDKGTEMEGVLAYDAANGILNMQDEMIFTREPIAAWTAAAPKADAVAEDFAGNWACVRMNVMGINGMTPDAAGMMMTAAIEGLHVAITIDMGGPSVDEGDAVFADGVLTLTIPATEVTSETIYTIEALEDGSISITFDMMGMPASFYCEAVAVEEAPAA